MPIKKQEILIKLVIDSREKKLNWLDKFKFDKKMGKDKIQIMEYEIHTPFKCIDSDGKKIKTSVGDVGIIYSCDGGETWTDTNLSIELKRDSDMSTTIYSNWKRFSSEIERAKSYGLDFYIVYNQSTKAMKEHFGKLKAMKKIKVYEKPEKAYYDRLVDVQKMGVPTIYTHEIHEVVRRIIKSYVKNNRLQY